MNIEKDNTPNMAQHLNILGWINIILGGLGLIAAFCGGLALFTIGIGASFEDPEALPILTIMAIFVFGLVTVLSLPSILGGWGLLKRKSWSRLLVIILSVLNVFSVPIGTVVGIYGLWVLFQDESRLLLEAG